MFQNGSIIWHNLWHNTYTILRIVQHSSNETGFEDQSCRADQLEYLKMKYEVHDKQITYLMVRIRQLYERNGQNDNRIAYLMSRISQQSGENVQQNNPARFYIGKLMKLYS